MNRLAREVYEELTSLRFDTRDLYGEHSRFHTVKRKTGSARRVPPFALNQTTLRLVLAVRVWRTLHGRKAVPRDVVCYWSRLDEMATAKFAKDPRTRHSLFVPKSYLAGQLSLAYGAWRRRLRSSDIARDYSVTVAFVDRNLRQIIGVAEELGFDTGGWSVAEEREAKRVLCRRQQRRLRASRTPEEREQKLEAIRVHHREMRKNWTKEEREANREYQREWARAKRAGLLPKKKTRLDDLNRVRHEANSSLVLGEHRIAHGAFEVGLHFSDAD